MSGSGRSRQSVRQAAAHLSILPACALCLASKLKAQKSSPKTLVSLQAHFYHLLFTVVERPVSPVGSRAHPRKSQGPNPLYYPAPRTPSPSFSPQLPLLCTPSAWKQALPYPAVLHSTALHSEAPPRNWLSVQTPLRFTLNPSHSAMFFPPLYRTRCLLYSSHEMTDFTVQIVFCFFIFHLPDISELRIQLK